MSVAALPTYGSLLHGGLEGHPRVCVVFWAAIGECSQAISGEHTVWLYVDDIVLHAPRSELPGLTQSVESGVTQELGGMLNKTKSVVRALCFAGAPWAQRPPDFKQATAASEPNPTSPPASDGYGPTRPTQEEDLAILGCDTAITRTIALGPYAAAAESTSKRLAKAEKLANAQTRSSKATAQSGRSQAAWTVGRLLRGECAEL